MFGTVLDDGDDRGLGGVMAAAGHGAAVYTTSCSRTGVDGRPPGAEEWVAAYADIPDDERHLAIHDRHLIAVNDRDRPARHARDPAGMGAVFHARRAARSSRRDGRGGHDRDRLPARRSRHPRELEAFADAVNG